MTHYCVFLAASVSAILQESFLVDTLDRRLRLESTA